MVDGAGGRGRRARPRRRVAVPALVGPLAGVVLVAVVAGGAAVTAVGVERDLQERACAAVRAQGLSGIAIAYSGRDAVLADRAGSLQQAAEGVAALFAVDGTRSVRVVPADRTPAGACVLPAAGAEPSAADAARGLLLTVRFGSDSADLDGPARAALDAVLVWLEAHPGVTLRAEGHADNTGLDTRNLPLSTQRAEAVADYLRDRGAGTVPVVGHGALKPAVPNLTAEGRRLNRRVEILVEEAAP